MMKVKTIFACLLALALAMPAGEAYAQTRKSGVRTGTRKAAGTKSSTTRPKAGSTATAAKPLTKADVEAHAYYGIMKFPGLEQVGKDVGFYTYLFLTKDGMIKWTMLGDKYNGEYSVPSNSVYVRSGDNSMRLTSPDGGKTLKGDMNNGRGMTIPLVFYQVKNGPLNSEVCKESFAKGTFKALMSVTTPKGEETMFPVDFKATPNEDGTGGTYKISVDNALGIGLIKGTYTITETGLLFTSNLEGCSTKEDAYFEYREEALLSLGKKYVDGSGNCTVDLHLFNQ
ncbi:MAG: hypothetical protein HDS66_09935 [Bacteroidales bacterium]|nr:hypothetical protein [Bacteroidales bacterium]